MKSERSAPARASIVAGVALVLAAGGLLSTRGSERASDDAAPAAASDVAARAQSEMLLEETRPALVELPLVRPEPSSAEDIASSGSLDVARRLAALEDERAGWNDEREALRRRVNELESELIRTSEDQLRREQQWLDFTRVLASLSTDHLSPEELARVLGGPRADASSAAPETEAAPSKAERALTRAEEARRARDAEIHVTLRSLFVVEQIDGLELLESGSLHAGATGPVVLRTADPWGRPVGTLTAERLRLEGSRAGRTLTLVLEDGYERRAAERIAFEGTPPGTQQGGERRIVLPGVDPARWIEALPELFELDTRAPLLDDGRWNATLVQAGLNELLRQDAAGGYYKLSALAGVLEGALRDVRVEEYDAAGRLERRLFADRLTIELEEQGVRIQLEDGVQMRDGRRLAFLEGRYRIFLPRAAQHEWRAMGLPGLVPPKESALATGSDLPLPARLRP